MDLIKDITATKRKGAQLWGYKRTLNGEDYDTDGVRVITITEEGAGYITAPAVTFSGGDPDVPAEAHSVLDEAGKVAEIIIDNPGSGYTTDPSITLAAAPQGGTTATASLSRIDIWHTGCLRKASEITFTEPLKTEPLEDGTPDFPESGDVTAELKLTLGQDDEATIKFLMRESKKYEFSLFYEKGKSTGVTTQQFFIPQTKLDRNYSSKSGERRPVANFFVIKNLLAVTPSDVPTFAKGDAEDYTVPAEEYFEVRDLA